MAQLRALDRLQVASENNRDVASEVTAEVTREKSRRRNRPRIVSHADEPGDSESNGEMYDSDGSDIHEYHHDGGNIHDDEDVAEEEEEETGDDVTAPELMSSACRIDITVEEAKDMQSDLIELYILADFRNVPDLRNDIMNTIILHRVQGWPLMSANANNIRRAFGRLPSNSKLCQYIADEATYCCHPGMEDQMFPNSLAGLPKRFFKAVTRIVFQDKMNSLNLAMGSWPKAKRDMCRYHEHDDRPAECVKTWKFLQSDDPKDQLSFTRVFARGPFTWS